uniref:BUB1 N-terminal domain-containing protein n=1 Tax=Macrostomum lignano TaxID=282301 RepID=A0A1I8FP34_9PLAT
AELEESKAAVTYDFMFHRGIGTMVAYFWYSYALALERKGDLKAAGDKYEHGIRCQAQPLDFLVEKVRLIFLLFHQITACRSPRLFKRRLAQQAGLQSLMLDGNDTQTTRPLIGADSVLDQQQQQLASAAGGGGGNSRTRKALAALRTTAGGQAPVMRVGSAVSLRAEQITSDVPRSAAALSIYFFSRESEFCISICVAATMDGNPSCSWCNGSRHIKLSPTDMVTVVTNTCVQAIRAARPWPAAATAAATRRSRRRQTATHVRPSVVVARIRQCGRRERQRAAFPPPPPPPAASGRQRQGADRSSKPSRMGFNKKHDGAAPGTSAAAFRRSRRRDPALPGQARRPTLMKPATLQAARGRQFRRLSASQASGFRGADSQPALTSAACPSARRRKPRPDQDDTSPSKCSRLVRAAFEHSAAATYATSMQATAAAELCNNQLNSRGDSGFMCQIDKLYMGLQEYAQPPSTVSKQSQQPAPQMAATAAAAPQMQQQNSQDHSRDRSRDFSKDNRADHFAGPGLAVVAAAVGRAARIAPAAMCAGCRFQNDFALVRCASSSSTNRRGWSTALALATPRRPAGGALDKEALDPSDGRALEDRNSRHVLGSGASSRRRELVWKLKL